MSHKRVFIKNEKKRDCSWCKSKLVDGKQILVLVDERGKRKAYLCSDRCADSHEARPC